MGDPTGSRDLASLEDVMMATERWILTAALVTCLPLTLFADTLYLRNGTRVQGDLVSVRGDTIEFQERSGFGSRTIRVDRREVARIEFDGNGGGGSGWGSGGTGWEGGGRPGGMRERQVNVSSTVDWTDTGVQVRAGQAIYVEASGQVRWGRDRRDGPAGEKNSPFNQARPLPNRPGAALIGRIGGDVFFIGEGQGPIRVRNSGRLELGINDEYLEDNSGSFRVTVFY
jgi:PA-IL-like protein